MSGRLPKYVSPLRLAQTRERLRGEIPLSEMPRLEAATGGQPGTVSVDLSFGRDEDGLYGIAGQVSADVELTCQRCLGALHHRLAAEVALGIITAEEQAVNLPEHYEPLLVKDERVVLAELVEDELLLGLPSFPRHDDAACAAVPAKPEPEKGEKRPNPFAVLARLKKRDEPEQ